MFEIETTQGFETKLWVEKFRPKHIEDIILPERLKAPLADMVKSGQIGNVLFVGGAGSGKTTSARALCNDVGVEYIIVNCSNDSGIDTVRTTISNYCNTASISAKNMSYKVIILDELDGFSNKSQLAMRGLIEEFASNIRFILTANDSNKIHSALRSRCIEFDFDMTAKERENLIPQVALRIVEIMDEEGIEWKEEQLPSVMKVVERFYPDMRKIVGTFNNYTKSGSLNDFVDFSSDSDMLLLVQAIQAKSFKRCLDWIMNHPFEIENIYNLKTGLYPIMQPLLKDESQTPTLIQILGDGNKNLYSCVDQYMQAAETVTLIFTSLEV